MLRLEVVGVVLSVVDVRGFALLVGDVVGLDCFVGRGVLGVLGAGSWFY